ncbi:MAG: GNAT family N-acetyltransferase [Gammaproteobacteria bacterium]
MVSLRPATGEDCAAVYRVQVDAIRNLPGGAAGREGTEKWLATRRPSGYARDMQEELFFVAEEQGEVIGWGALSTEKQEITNVFVDPAHHRRGVGRAIIRTLENAAREAGLKSVTLRATGTAIEFYLATGYRADPPVEPGAAWALMTKAL